MKILFVISILFFYISYGAAYNYSHKEFSSWEVMPFVGRLLKNIIYILCCILPAISLCFLFNMAWYWSVLINFICCITLSHLLAAIYCSIWGYKTKNQFDYSVGIMSRKHLYSIDMLITFGIAIVLFFIALNLS